MTITAIQRTGDLAYSLSISTDEFAALILPEIGGKIASFSSRRAGYEYLWQPPDGVFSRPDYGAEYASHFATGFDECFPTILPCDYPDAPHCGVVVPDHGEVWTLAWSYRIGPRHIALSAEGRCLPYRLTKTVSVECENSLTFWYELQNLDVHPLRYLWSAHPLFNVRDDTVLQIDGSPWVEVFESASAALGARGTRHVWPRANDSQSAVDLSHPGSRRRAADKVFLGSLHSGQVLLAHKSLGEALLIEFPLEFAPFLGVWFNIYGWPEGDPHCNLGIEPTTTPSDLLTHSRNLLGGHCVQTWWMRWTLQTYAAGG